MVGHRLLRLGVAAWIGTAALAVATKAPADANDPTSLDFLDPTGQFRTISVRGPIDSDNPFFQDLGTNGRRCVTCHQPSAGWTITPLNVAARFLTTGGNDPIFTSNDGSNCEGAVSHNLIQKASNYSMLLSRGLIRVGLDLPDGAEFVLDSVKDPFHCGPASNQFSAYRRVLPATNLTFLSAVMWDGRESSATTTITQDLAHQANDATRGHAQALQDLTASQQNAIVMFETGLYSAQVRDFRAGNLALAGATGGPKNLSAQPFFIGINDPVGLNPTSAPFNPDAATLFDAWSALTPAPHDPVYQARSAILRGEAIFDSKKFTISGVAGLNGQTFSSGVTVPASFSGTCTMCHDTPNVGDHSVKAPLDIGTADPAQAPYLPVYTLRNLKTNQTVKTTDPGRALISGLWSDIGKFKGPVLRDLAARGPYFHNGSAATLEDAVDFYDKRFNIGLTAQEKSDLVAFLRAM